MADRNPESSKRSKVEKTDNEKFVSKRANMTTIFDDFIQTAIRQLPSSCIYAALSMHIGYNLRVAYKNKSVSEIKLPPGSVIDHEEWEKELKTLYGKKVSRVPALLEYAQKNGVPLLNTGLKLTVDGYKEIDMASPGVVDRMKEILQQWSILVVLELHKDYLPVGKAPFMGRGGPIVEPSGVRPSHAVVILASYEDPSLFRANEDASEALWLFQNSNGLFTDSYLGNGLNVLRHRVIVKAYVVKVYPTNVLVKTSYYAMLESLRKQPTQELTEDLGAPPAEAPANM